MENQRTLIFKIDVVSKFYKSLLQQNKEDLFELVLRQEFYDNLGHKYQVLIDEQKQQINIQFDPELMYQNNFMDITREMCQKIQFQQSYIDSLFSSAEGISDYVTKVIFGPVKITIEIQIPYLDQDELQTFQFSISRLVFNNIFNLSEKSIQIYIEQCPEKYKEYFTIQPHIIGDLFLEHKQTLAQFTNILLKAYIPSILMTFLISDRNEWIFPKKDEKPCFTIISQIHPKQDFYQIENFAIISVQFRDQIQYLQNSINQKQIQPQMLERLNRISDIFLNQLFFTFSLGVAVTPQKKLKISIKTLDKYKQLTIAPFQIFQLRQYQNTLQQMSTNTNVNQPNVFENMKYMLKVGLYRTHQLEVWAELELSSYEEIKIFFRNFFAFLYLHLFHLIYLAFTQQSEQKLQKNHFDKVYFSFQNDFIDEIIRSSHTEIIRTIYQLFHNQFKDSQQKYFQNTSNLIHNHICLYLFLIESRKRLNIKYRMAIYRIMKILFLSAAELYQEQVDLARLEDNDKSIIIHNRVKFEFILRNDELYIRVQKTINNQLVSKDYSIEKITEADLEQIRQILPNFQNK